MDREGHGRKTLSSSNRSVNRPLGVSTDAATSHLGTYHVVIRPSNSLPRSGLLERAATDDCEKRAAPERQAVSQASPMIGSSGPDR